MKMAQHPLLPLILLAPALLFYELMQLAWLVRQGRGRVWWRALREFTRQRRRIFTARRDVQSGRLSRDATILRDAPLPLTRHVRQQGPRYLLPWGERLLRGYWHLVRHWV
jgi:hypothetical protein